MIELGVEFHLVLFASGPEQFVSVLAIQERLDGVLPPALAATGLRLALPVIGVHRLVAQRGGSDYHARLPAPDIPVINSRSTGRAYAAVAQHPAWLLISEPARPAA